MIGTSGLHLIKWINMETLLVHLAIYGRLACINGLRGCWDVKRSPPHIPPLHEGAYLQILDMRYSTAGNVERRRYTYTQNVLQPGRGLLPEKEREEFDIGPENYEFQDAERDFMEAEWALKSWRWKEVHDRMSYLSSIGDDKEIMGHDNLVIQGLL